MLSHFRPRTKQTLNHLFEISKMDVWGVSELNFHIFKWDKNRRLHNTVTTIKINNLGTFKACGQVEQVHCFSIWAYIQSEQVQTKTPRSPPTFTQINFIQVVSKVSTVHNSLSEQSLKVCCLQEHLQHFSRTDLNLKLLFVNHSIKRSPKDSIRKDLQFYFSVKEHLLPVKFHTQEPNQMSSATNQTLEWSLWA